MEGVPNGGPLPWAWPRGNPDAWLPVSVSHLPAPCFKQAISMQKNLQVPLLWLLFYLLNVHINEYVLFIDVFRFRNIELEEECSKEDLIY